jgi:hypothetical protein
MWPWRRNREVAEALEGSARRLDEIKKVQAEMEPRLRLLRQNAAPNHFEEAITMVFKVAE